MSQPYNTCQTWKDSKIMHITQNICKMKVSKWLLITL